MRGCAYPECTMIEGHAGPHTLLDNRPISEDVFDQERRLASERKAAGTLTVKLVLDTTEFDAALTRVREAVQALNETPIHLRLES